MLVKLTLADHIEPGSYEAHQIATAALRLIADLPHDPSVTGRKGKVVWRDVDLDQPSQLMLIGPDDYGRAEATYVLSTITT
ncbi:hypothetical protein D869_gp245 [Caulobacter phage CcrRogue]|uniref:Uncharacterized protein n=1 Tax=Caulobacter phage CcrRogue TaxID=2927986 RepID=K4JN76_9CAUD|nr:hypothetical protein D869_gp245 [Caulobacter phage CcrRogue]AFU86669.1 hypothetical protein CcrRogue_gp187 [Caulobacter phage CcrRogue]